MIQVQRSAAHEAGHLTFAIVLDWSISGASVNGGLHGFGGVNAQSPRNEHEIADDIPVDGNWSLVVAEYENLILQLAAGAAGERIVFGNDYGAGAPDIEYSDWGLILYLLDRWEEGKLQDRPTLRFGEAAPFTAAVEAAQAWLMTEPHLQLFHAVRELLETQQELTSAQCAELRDRFLARSSRHSHTR